MSATTQPQCPDCLQGFPTDREVDEHVLAARHFDDEPEPAGPRPYLPPRRAPFSGMIRPGAGPRVDADELRLLATYADGPRIWDAASVYRLVLQLDAKGLIAPADGGTHALTAAGRRALGLPTDQVARFADALRSVGYSVTALAEDDPAAGPRVTATLPRTEHE
jgi:hypothetical protein